MIDDRLTKERDDGSRKMSVDAFEKAIPRHSLRVFSSSLESLETSLADNSLRGLNHRTICGVSLLNITASHEETG